MSNNIVDVTKAKESLEEAIKAFNIRLSDWEREFGAKATFGWYYPKEHGGNSRLRLTEAHVNIHTEPPSEDTIQSVVDAITSAPDSPVIMEGDPR